MARIARVAASSSRAPSPGPPPGRAGKLRRPAGRSVLGRRRSLASCLSLRNPHSATLFPFPESRPSAAVCRLGSSLVPRPARLWRVPPCLRASVPPCRSYSSVLCILDYTFLPRDGCPHVSCSPFPVPCSPLLGVIHNGVCPCVHVKTIKFGSKSIKKATFSVKKGQKRRAFRHAHLNILGGHPLWR
jgi:hypothetical protein